VTQGVAFQPTEKQRRTVKAMAGLGVPHESIAVLLEIDPKTLRKHFDQELARGSVEATAKMAQCLFQMATAGKNVAAAIFRMKARAGGLAGEARSASHRVHGPDADDGRAAATHD
jgi:hypothetical protein